MLWHVLRWCALLNSVYYQNPINRCSLLHNTCFLYFLHVRSKWWLAKFQVDIWKLTCNIHFKSLIKRTTKLLARNSDNHISHKITHEDDAKPLKNVGNVWIHLQKLLLYGVSSQKRYLKKIKVRWTIHESSIFLRYDGDVNIPEIQVTNRLTST